MNVDVIVIAAYREYLVSPGPRGGIKQTFLIRRKPDKPLDEFYAYWLGRHAEDTKKIVETCCPGKTVRISMSVAIEQRRTSTPVENRTGEWKSGKGIDWCGVKEMWFPDRESMEACKKAVG